MIKADLSELKTVLLPGQRLMGLDLGEKTIGLALSDTLLTVATPFQTLKRGKFTADAAALGTLIAQHGVGGLVVGLPLNMDGTPGTHHDDVVSYAKALTEFLRLDVLLVDERRTTMQAEHHLKRVGAGGWKKRKERVDEVAAAIILQSWLDASTDEPPRA